SNSRIPVPETGALPLGDPPVPRLGIAPSSPAFQTGAVTRSADEACSRDPPGDRTPPDGVKDRLPHQQHADRGDPRRFRTEPARLERPLTSPEVERAAEPAMGVAPIRAAYGAAISLGETGRSRCARPGRGFKSDAFPPSARGLQRKESNLWRTG